MLGQPGWFQMSKPQSRRLGAYCRDVPPGQSPTSNQAAALPVCRGRVFGGGLLPKAGLFALLLGLPLGASLLTAGEKPHQPQYRFTEIALPGPGEGYRHQRPRARHRSLH